MQASELRTGSNILHHVLTGNEGVFVKEYKPTGKPLTTQIKLADGRIYYAPSNEFVPTKKAVLL